jgi:hypothetical protein
METPIPVIEPEVTPDQYPSVFCQCANSACKYTFLPNKGLCYNEYDGPDLLCSYCREHRDETHCHVCHPCPKGN